MSRPKNKLQKSSKNTSMQKSQSRKNATVFEQKFRVGKSIDVGVEVAVNNNRPVIRTSQELDVLGLVEDFLTVFSKK